MTFLREGATTAAGEGIEGGRPKAPGQSSRAAIEWAARGWRSIGGGREGGERVQSAIGARPELVASDRVGGARVEEQRRGGERGEEHYLRRRWRRRNPNHSCRRRAEGND